MRMGGGRGARAGARFAVDTTSAPSGPNVVRVNGKSLRDNRGPFLGLGASYFQALRRAKFDRARLTQRSGLARVERLQLRAHPQHGELGRAGNCAGEFHQQRRARPWRAGRITAQQFRDMLDIICRARHARRGHDLRRRAVRHAEQDRRGWRTSTLHPRGHRGARSTRSFISKSRTRHGKTVFPARPASADLREFAQYLADRTSVPVAITSNDDLSDAGIIALNVGSAADLATVHFSRDTRHRRRRLAAGARLLPRGKSCRACRR